MQKSAQTVEDRFNEKLKRDFAIPLQALSAQNIVVVKTLSGASCGFGSGLYGN